MLWVYSTQMTQGPRLFFAKQSRMCIAANTLRGDERDHGRDRLLHLFVVHEAFSHTNIA